MRRRVNVRGIIINENGEIFCQQLTANNGKGRNFWCTPGGGLEMGESLLDGLRREMIEETGVKPEIGKLLFIQQFAESGEQSAHGPNEQLEFFLPHHQLARLPAHQPGANIARRRGSSRMRLCRSKNHADYAKLFNRG